MIVAIVPAKDAESTIGETVAAVAGLVDRVVVVDDGSADGTADAALAAGATVVRLSVNEGKGAAVTAAVEATPEASVYLLVDADTEGSAAAAAPLLQAVLDDRADMAVGRLPGVGKAGGFGLVRRLSANGIRRATGFRASAPLSGQRAIKAELLRSLLPLAYRFGLETALTADAAKSGARVVELEVPIRHRPPGRTPAGFAHRARQGSDIVRALWPRLTSRRFRVTLIVAGMILASVASLWSANRAVPSSVGMAPTYNKVVVFGFPGLSWDDVRSGRAPNFDRLAGRGALAGSSVRTLTNTPSAAEAWATIGAGTRVAANSQAGYAFQADEPVPYEPGTAADALHNRTGRPANGIVVLGAPATTKLNKGKHLSSQPGALGDALHAAGKKTAVVGNGDTGVTATSPGIDRPAAAAVMDGDGVVDTGQVGTGLLQDDPAAPFGRRADAGAFLSAVEQAQSQADVVAVDPGDMERAMAFSSVATSEAAGQARANALAATDGLLGQVADRLPPGTLLLVTALTPPGKTWHVQPTLAVGQGVPAGYLHSPSVRRLGIVTITDLAPTVLHALGASVPDTMIGHALRFHPGQADTAMLQRTDREANYREGYYFPISLAYIIFQALVYLAAAIALTRPGGSRIGRWAGPLRWTVLGVAAFPLASFLFRAVPGGYRLGAPGLLLMLAIDLAMVALAMRARRHPLSPLSWILGATVAVICVDIATGARLETSSLLGYSLHTAARFSGIGNTGFAALASATILAAVLHLHWAQRRPEALIFVGALFAFVILVDGAPSLGDDVGGILTLVPVFGVLFLVLAGRRIRWRTVLLAGGATAAILALATGVDLLRPPESRTHLGRFAASLAKRGSSDFTTTVTRKLATNLRTYKSPWCWIVLIIALYAIYMLGWRRGWSRFLTPGSALRAGAVATLAAGVIGNVLNDSGVVVTALVFVYVGPFLTLLALDGERPAPAIREPDVAAATQPSAMAVRS